jgi:hypothetical protein
VVECWLPVPCLWQVRHMAVFLSVNRPAFVAVQAGFVGR